MNNPYGATLQHMYMRIFLLGQWRSASNTSHPLRASKGVTVSPSLLKALKDLIADASVDWCYDVHRGRSAPQLVVLVYSVPAPCIGSLRKTNFIMRLLTINNNVYRHHTGQRIMPLLEFHELFETHSREEERNIILHHSICASSVSMLVQTQTRQESETEELCGRVAASVESTGSGV